MRWYVRGVPAPSVSGVDRTMTRYRRVAAETQILRHVYQRAQEEDESVTRAVRDLPDRHQLKGAPVIVLKTPAWPREDWAEPQRRRVRRGW
jgi:hypothetical protein